MVLPPGAGLHPGRDVDGEGAHGAHDQGHRVGMEPARSSTRARGVSTKTPTSAVSGTACAMSRAASGVTWRGLAGWKLSPRKSAPAATAARASSTVHTPQILTFTGTGATPRGPRPGRDGP